MLNFFEHQEQARKSTQKLILAFVFSVVAIIILVNLVFHFYVLQAGESARSLQNAKTEIHTYISLFLLVLIGVGTTYKTLFLMRKGGSYIASSLGGTLISSDSRDADHRKILNIVEEMAIASGCATPRVYVLEKEDSINAFAAGWVPSESVIGVTRGSIQKLSREELQGVIAHEFSHILNGDMRLNLWMMGILHGLFLITLIGEIMLRSRSHSRSRSGNDKGAGGLIAAGLLLYVAGYIGVISGNIIKAAISRQREYLADSSAVQFTRNPAGIARALRKIKVWGKGSTLTVPSAKEASHLFFGNVLSSSFSSLFATHPPLNERITRLDPAYDGNDHDIESQMQKTYVSHQETTAKSLKPKKGKEDLYQILGSVALSSQVARPGVKDSERISAKEGHMQFDFTRDAVIPEDCLQWTKNAVQAKVLCYHLFLSKDLKIQQNQKQMIGSQENAYLRVPLERFEEKPLVRAEWRYPLVELCIPSLKDMSKSQYMTFKTVLEDLVHADKKIEGFELALYMFITHHLDGCFEQKPWKGVQYLSWKGIKHALEILFGFLSAESALNPSGVKEVFDYGSRHIPIPLQLPTKGPILSEALFDELKQSVQIISSTAPLMKKKILAGCMDIMGHDKKIVISEWDMLRAICACMECPVPL